MTVLKKRNELSSSIHFLEHQHFCRVLYCTVLAGTMRLSWFSRRLWKSIPAIPSLISSSPLHTKPRANYRKRLLGQKLLLGSLLTTCPLKECCTGSPAGTVMQCT